MSDSPIQLRVFEDTTDWHRTITRQWGARPTVDLHGSIDPPVVEAASGHTLVVKLIVGPELTLPRGAHLTLEVRATWEAHLGNCFRRGVRTVGNREQVRPGYGAVTEAECSNPQVRLALCASYGRHLDLVDVVVTEGECLPGDELRLVLGLPDGNLVQAQKYAQVAIFPVGVDLIGDGVYRSAATQPEVRVVGAYPDRLRLFAPAVVAQNEAFDLRVLPVDVYSFNPATRYRGRAQLRASKGIDLATAEVEIDTGTRPYGAAVSVVARSPGVATITAFDPDLGISGKSNPILVKAEPARRIYFGEMHSQMWHSMGTGTTAEFFQWGRDAAGLDFCAPANHYNWRFEVTEEIWRELIDTTNAFNQPGRFVTLISYEWAGSDTSGHKNVYYRAAAAEFSYYYKRQMEAEDLWGSLKGYEAITVPHHTRALGGVDWRHRNDSYQRLVEICSNWGISEEGGPHSVQAALALGHRLGFVGGTDSHYGLANQGSYHVNDGNGLACVVAPALTREALWQALHDRRCYATTGDRIILDFSLDGQPMGSDLSVDLAEAGPRRLSVQVAGTYRIDAIEIVRNNQVVCAAHPEQDVWEGEWVDNAPLPPLAYAPSFPDDRPFVFYYLRVTQGNRQLAWASPIWLTQRP